MIWSQFYFAMRFYDTPCSRHEDLGSISFGVYTGFAEKNMKALEFEDEVMVSKKEITDSLKVEKSFGVSHYYYHRPKCW